VWVVALLPPQEGCGVRLVAPGMAVAKGRWRYRRVAGSAVVWILLGGSWWALLGGSLLLLCWPGAGRGFPRAAAKSAAAAVGVAVRCCWLLPASVPPPNCLPPLVL